MGTVVKMYHCERSFNIYLMPNGSRGQKSPFEIYILQYGKKIILIFIQFVVH